MKKRVISILLSAAMISSMVVAGGVTAHAEENVTLNVFDAHAYGLEEYDEMVKAFEESHPGVTVDVQHAANDYDTLLQSRVNSGDTPDVFDAEAGTKAKMYYDYAYDWSNDTEVLDKFNEDAVNLGKDDEGNVKSLPWTYENMGLIYNKDALDKAGVDPNSIRTWDDFDAACEKLVAAGITPLASGGSVGGNLAGLLGSVAPTFWTDEGAKYDLGDSLKDGTFDFDTYATELYEYLATWMKKGYINEDVLTLDAAGAQQMLGSGEAAFMVRGTDNITVARQYYPDANMGVLPLPSSADGAPSFRVGEGDAWGVWKDTENEAACWALLDYLARPEVGSKWATVSGALPTVEGADAADVYTLNCYKQAVEDCNGKVQYDNLFDRKFFPSGMWGIMADSMSMMLSNPDDVTEAVEYLRDNYLELYAEQNG